MDDAALTTTRPWPLRIAVWGIEAVAATAVIGLVIAVSMPAQIGPSAAGIDRAQDRVRQTERQVGRQNRTRESNARETRPRDTDNRQRGTDRRQTRAQPATQ